jgi:hypothetical protein
MPTQTTGDPFSTVVLMGFIVALLGIIHKMHGDRVSDRDKTIADRDKRIEKLEAKVDLMAERSTSLAQSVERMLNFFIDREEVDRSEPSPSRGGRSP